MIERETVLQMPVSEEIHHSIADADDIEEVWDPRISVADVLKNLLWHPAQIITRWNWKSASLGAVLRASFYFTVYQASQEPWLVTMTAVIVELTFRFITTGISGAVVQSFRKAQPVWAANLIVSIMLPAFSHTVEFFTHYAQERYFFDIFVSPQNSVARQRAFALSVLFSVVSALFNLFAMKHGVLLVGAGDETRSFKDDIKRMPRMVGEFTAFLPVLISKYIETGKLIKALAAFTAFGLGVGIILGTFRGFRWEWAYRSAAGAWVVLLFAVILTFSVRYVLLRKGKMYRKRY